jgi:WD40 repeat protein
MGRTAWLWDLDTGQLVMTVMGHTAGAYSPDGTRLVTGGREGAARAWETATGKLLLALAAHPCGNFGFIFA